MERIGAVQARVDRIVAGQTDATDIKFGYVHLYSVSQACALLAMKRQENVELAAIAGLLHDIYAYKTGARTDHAHQGGCPGEGDYAGHRPVFRRRDGNGSRGDLSSQRQDSPFDEVLKDADVLQHCLIMPLAEPAPHEAARFSRLKDELGIG